MEPPCINKTPLTEAQEKVLTPGPDFAVVAKEPPIGEIVAQIEKSVPTTETREGRRIER